MEHHRAPGEYFGHHSIARDAVQERMPVAAPGRADVIRALDVLEYSDQRLGLRFAVEMHGTIDEAGVECARHLRLEFDEIVRVHAGVFNSSIAVCPRRS